MILVHGAGPPPSGWWLQWPFEPLVWVALVALGWFYFVRYRRLRSWPKVRAVHFAGGLMVLAVALAGPVAAYDRALFWVHMVQHLLVTLVAAPLLLLGAPMSLVMRTAAPSARRRALAALHSPVSRSLTHPAASWTIYGLVMVVSHYSPLYDAALENEVIHVLEHALFLFAALLFWGPVIGLDPGGRRLTWPLRLGYLLLVMPQQAFLALSLYSGDSVLYDHYASLERTWGPNPLDDQRLAAAVMWVVGDGLILVAIVFCVFAWMRADNRLAEREDRRLGVAGGLFPRAPAAGKESKLL